MEGPVEAQTFPSMDFGSCFRKKYGAGSKFFVDQPFGADATDEFDEIILRGGFIIMLTALAPNPQKVIRDQLLILLRSCCCLHGMFVHLYLNGLY